MVHTREAYPAARQREVDPQYPVVRVETYVIAGPVLGDDCPRVQRTIECADVTEASALVAELAGSIEAQAQAYEDEAS